MIPLRRPHIPVEVPHPGRVAPWMQRVIRRVLGPAVRACHRPSWSGWQHVPDRGPYLLVANHSGGVGAVEIQAIASAWLDRFGTDRPLAAFVLPADFRMPGLAAVVRGLGAVPATFEAARHTLDRGVPLLVFPGGDHESLRPIWQANRVDLGGRLGFLRIARDARVPIVPLGIRGGHLTAPVLFRSRWLATLLVGPRLVGVRRWGVTVPGLAGAALIAALVPGEWWLRALLAWAWLGSPFIYGPWVPWPIRLRFGPPIPPEALFGEAGDTPRDAPASRSGGPSSGPIPGSMHVPSRDPKAATATPPPSDDTAVLRRALATVQSAIQALVDEAARPTPSVSTGGTGCGR